MYCTARESVYIAGMKTNILQEIETFQERFGLSDHRVGIVLAKNGRLVERLRSGSRIWPDTEENVRSAIVRETKKRTQEAAQ